MDSQYAQRAFTAALGGCPYPILADFHPKGQVAQAYGIYNEENGANRRAIFIVDKKGILRFAKVYDRGLPEATDILSEVVKLA